MKQELVTLVPIKTSWIEADTENTLLDRALVTARKIAPDAEHLTHRWLNRTEVRNALAKENMAEETLDTLSMLRVVTLATRTDA